MNTEQKLEELLNILLHFKTMPVNELIDNKKLVSEIQNALTGTNFKRILDSLWRERQLEQQITNVQNTKSGNKTLKQLDDEILPAYVKYQNAAFPLLQKRGTNYTELLSSSNVMAFNADRKKTNPFANSEIKKLPEAQKFAAVFNSIYSDRSLQINTDRDPTLMSSYIDYSPYVTNYQYYLSIPTLDQTIDFPIDLATKHEPIIKFDDDKLTEEFALFFKRSDMMSKIKKLLFYSALSPRGALVVPIKDGNRIRFNVFNDTQFTYAASQQYSTIDFKDTTTGVGQLFCLGHMLQNEVTAHFLCPGFEPIYAIGKNRIYRLKEAAEAINIYLYTIKVLCIRAQILVQKWAGEGGNDTKLRHLQNLATRINSELSLSTLQQLPQDSELEILSSNFTPGFADVQPIIKEFQGMITGVMPDYFYGSDTAYNANAFNLNVTHQNIHSQMQIAQIEPALRFMINTVLRYDERFSKYKSADDDFDIEFPSLYEMSETEKADLDKKKIENIQAMADYAELKKVFIAEKLLREDVNFPDNFNSPDKEGGAEGDDSGDTEQDLKKILKEEMKADKGKSNKKLDSV